MNEELTIKPNPTIPWDKDELLHYRGFGLTYTVWHDGRLFVHFPGGCNYETTDLTDKLLLRMPKRLRRGG